MIRNDIQIRFGAVAQQRRKALGISQEELAHLTDLHRTYISDVERGARNISLQSMHKLAQGLRVSIADFFPKPAPEISDQNKLPPV